MELKVLFRKKGELTWREPKVRPYDNEQALQNIIEKSPVLVSNQESLAVAVINQVPIPGSTGFLDLLGVDEQGGIILVECKLRANPEIRRHVVGQLLAYAAGLWGTSYEEFARIFSQRNEGHGLIEYLVHLSGKSEEDWDRDALRQSVAANLQAGRFRLVLAVDEITDELKRVVEYLNQHTASEIQVIAVELGLMEHEDFEVLIPASYGEQTTDTNGARGSQWDEASLLAVLQKRCLPEGIAAFRELYDFTKRNGYFYWGSGAAYPSVTAWFPFPNGESAVWSCYGYPKGPTFDINFEWMVKRGVPIHELRGFADKLRGIDGVVAQRFSELEGAGYRKRPSLPIDLVLTRPNAASVIKSAIEELVATQLEN